jgi:hypothetical protein
MFWKEEHVSKEQIEAACEPVGYVVFVFLVGDWRQPQPYSENLLLSHLGYSLSLKLNAHLTSRRVKYS